MTPLRALHADLLALSQEEREQAGNNLVVATAPDDLLRAGAQPEDSWMIRMLVRQGCLTHVACLAQLLDCMGLRLHLQQAEGFASEEFLAPPSAPPRSNSAAALHHLYLHPSHWYLL